MNRIEKLTRLPRRMWVYSGGWHLLAAAILLLAIPAQKLLNRTQASQPDPTARAGPSPVPSGAAAQEPDHLAGLVSPAQMEKMVQQIQKQQGDSARQRVARILEKEKEMDRIARQSISDFQDKAKDAASSLAPSLVELHKNILAAQQSSLAAQTELKRQVEESHSKAPTNEPLPDKLNDVRQLQAKADSIRSLAATLQSQQARAMDQLGEAAMSLPHVAKAQEKAAEAQSAAADIVEKQGKLLGQIKNLLERSSASTQSTVKAQAQIALEQARLTIQQNSLSAHQAQLDKARQDLKNLKDAQPSKTQLAEATRLIQQNLKQVAAEQRLATARQKSLERLSNSKDAETQKALRESQAADEVTGQVAQALQEGMEAQTVAIQREIEALNQAGSSAGNAESTTPSISRGDLKALEQPGPAIDSLETKELGELHQMALEAEQRLNEKFRIARAAQLASIQHLPFDKALAAVRPVISERKSVDSAALSSEGARNKFPAFKEQVIQAQSQIDSIASTAENLVSEAASQTNSGTPTIHLQGGNSSDDFRDRVASAMADDVKVGKDLTAAMKQHANEAASSVPGARSPVGNGGQAAGNKEKDAPGAVPPLQSRGLVHEYGRLDNELPSLDPNQIDAVPTRKITASSGPHHKEWIYVDTWYIIGPFPDEDRRNLYTKFPPESVIDLDAVYVGKSNKPAGWKLFQWSSPMLKMPNDLQETPAVYYAYTELSFDRPMDLWIATGSDDRGTMWLNGFMIWNSNDHLKKWQPNEGYRKVHFQEGRNRILYRLENGLSDAAFSLMIHTSS